MSRFPRPREWYVPNGATKIADKQSDAVVYVYTDARNRIGAVAFHGRASKPDWHFTFRDAAHRERRVLSFFEARRTVAARVVQRAAERKAWVHDYKVGDILNTCWGYEQTNREWFEVVALAGRTQVVLREIAAERIETAWCQGKTVPLPGQYVSEPITRKAGRHGVRIDESRTASRAATEVVGGVTVVKPVHWTAYH